MEISIVIPAYNAAKTIGKAIQSCFDQTVQALEITVVLDGCTDDTETIVRTHYPAVNIISLSKNSGVSFARNTGIRQAKGDWVACLDADDEMHPDRIKILSFYANQFPEAQMFVNRYSEKSFPDYSFPPRQEARKESFYDILVKNKVQGASICLKNEGKCYFNENFRYCEDHELALRIAWEGGCFSIPYYLTRLGRPQISKGGLSGSRWKMRLGEMRMYCRLWRFQPLFILLIPVLLLFSLVKHLVSVLRNYTV